MKSALLTGIFLGIFTILWAEGFPQWVGIQWMGAEAFQKIPSSDDRHFSASTTFANIGGSVTIVAEVFPGPSAGPSETILYLKTGNGAVKVNAGPSWFISSRGFKFAAGDNVRVRGAWMPSKSGTFLSATEVRQDGRILRLRAPDGTPLWKH